MSIQVVDLYKKYDDHEVLKKISFTIPQGRIVALLGPNGAGKSTTMKIINGYLKPDAGHVLINNQPIHQNPLKAQAQIGYLPEQNPLYTDFYVKEYLEFIANIHQLKNPKTTIQNVIHDVGLTKEANKKIEQLSKGYKQRVGLAAAILHDPQILILDEPTSGLDPNQVQEIRLLIKNLSKQKTIIFSTHILQEVQAVCDDLILIHQGNIVEQGSLKNIQQKYASTTLYLKTKNTLSASDFAPLKPFYNHIQQVSPHEWHFDPIQIDALKKNMLNSALQNNWEIESIYQHQKTLETIFSNLTSK